MPDTIYHSCVGEMLDENDLVFYCTSPDCGFRVEYVWNEEKKSHARQVITKGKDPTIIHAGSISVSGLGLDITVS